MRRDKTFSNWTRREIPPSKARRVWTQAELSVNMINSTQTFGSQWKERSQWMRWLGKDTIISRGPLKVAMKKQWGKVLNLISGTKKSNGIPLKSERLPVSRVTGQPQHSQASSSPACHLPPSSGQHKLSLSCSQGSLLLQSHPEVSHREMSSEWLHCPS